ncbi:MAG: glycosyltransferase [Gammaproteobacteria bacterium]|nr:glycosyltransferase [Gammaproteobacteria bacterium]
MRIFYGVQGTGNGHITRARVMAKELQQAGIEVDFQFSGRNFEQYFDMEVFNGYQLKHGLSFSVNHGKVSYVKTALASKPITFIKEITNLDLTGYDKVITDFEPVTAWAAKTQGIPVLGLGHQYAFKFNIPKQGSDPLADLVMRYFAPADRRVGFHWHHFGQAILPPIVEAKEAPAQINRHKILVYLPFEDTQEVINVLQPFQHYEFHVYSPNVAASPVDHIHCFPLSREGFQNDLRDCVGIISNAGFELARESLMLGKKILVKPLNSQMEQISNAAALKQLGYGYTMETLDRSAIKHWLHHGRAVKVNYPNTAKILVNWLQAGMPEMTPDFIESVWQKVDVIHVQH